MNPKQEESLINFGIVFLIMILIFGYINKNVSANINTYPPPLPNETRLEDGGNYYIDPDGNDAFGDVFGDRNFQVVCGNNVHSRMWYHEFKRQQKTYSLLLEVNRKLDLLLEKEGISNLPPVEKEQIEDIQITIQKNNN